MGNVKPKHSNPSRPRQGKENQAWAHAPYNFVPLPDKMVIAQEPLGHDVYDDAGLTGWITCELETCAPTYIRGMMTEVQFQEQSQKKPEALTLEEKLERAPFFATGGAPVAGYLMPVIPGSALRGMIRALVEIAGYGRMRWVGAEPTFTFRAVAAAHDDPLRQPYEEIMGRHGSKVCTGYLVREAEGWYIQPAQHPQKLGFSERHPYLKVKERQIPARAIVGYVRLNSSGYHPGYYRVSFEAESRPGRRGQYVAVTRIGELQAGYRYQGTLVCSGNMLETSEGGESPRKSHVLVLEPDAQARPVLIKPQVIADYLTGLTPYQKENLWGGVQGCLQEGAPVFYIADGQEVVAFGHSPNFRVPARVPGADRASRIRDFIPDNLVDSSHPDLADAIFGWVTEEGVELPAQRAGRVSFQDAHFIAAKDGVWLKPEPIIPHILSGPKSTTFQHYLVQDAHQGHDPDDKSRLAHYGTAPAQTQIRGHKVYWHKGSEPDIAATATELQHETQLTRIMPLRPGVRFTFRVRFENLRSEELGALLWALILPGETGKVYRHKIGMGKPLGMGAVAITPKLYLTQRTERYAHLFANEVWDEAAQAGEIQPHLAAFETFVLKQLDEEVPHLAAVERIHMLLALLEWHESNPAWLETTRYMEVEHGPDKVNEYKERPVLPDPLAVLAGQPVRPPTPIREQIQQTADLASPPRIKIGVVKKWFDDKGYGFILQEDGSDIFVHHSGIVGSARKSLRPGQRVQYTVGKNMQGRSQAQNVQELKE